MSQSTRSKSVLFLIALIATTTWLQNRSSRACPFCAAVKQTIRQEMETMDAVALGELVPDPSKQEIDGAASFKILSVLKGDSLIQVDTVIEASYFGPAKSDKRFLLMGVDPKDLLWSSPLPISSKSEEYIKAIPGLPTDPIKRLEFYYDYLENEESLLARDAYDEFAITPYDQVKLVKSKMDRPTLLKWIQDDSLSPDRKRLYLTLLGVCGEKKDADLLETRMRSEDSNAKAGLDAMIACYLTLKGDEGLPLIDELFLKNTKSQYPETYSAIMALRFHGTEGGILERSKIVKCLHSILARPELADLVIPDLARWEDWSQLERMVALFKEADDKSSWVRVPVINYLRACPLPEAAAKLEELEKIDPKAVQRAKVFFPIPAPSQPSTSTSSEYRVRDSSKALTRNLLMQPSITAEFGESIASADQSASTAWTRGKLHFSSSVDSMNRWVLFSVFSMATLTLALVMWLIVSGSGRPDSLIAQGLARVFV